MSKTGTWYTATDYLAPLLAGIGRTITSTIIGTGGLGLFVAGNDSVYFYDSINRQVNVWSANMTISHPVMMISTYCRDLFADENNTLYCSVTDLHQVVTKALTDPTNTLVTVAGTGCAGPASDQLYYPGGIFVRFNVGIYVADAFNNRIQRFSPGQMIATTLAGFGAPGTISLNHPMDVVLDGDGYVFIVDTENHRIIGSGPRGFRCVAGCMNASGSASNQLTRPQSMSFDSDGNIWVADTGNGRVQNFTVNNVSFGEHLRVEWNG